MDTHLAVLAVHAGLGNLPKAGQRPREVVRQLLDEGLEREPCGLDGGGCVSHDGDHEGLTIGSIALVLLQTQLFAEMVLIRG